MICSKGMTRAVLRAAALWALEARPKRRGGIQIEKRAKRPHIKAAARDATGVSTVRGGRRSCDFAVRQQLVEGAPVSRMPFCG